jgi:hypothetical protein
MQVDADTRGVGYCGDSPGRGCQSSECHYKDHIASKRSCNGKCDYWLCSTQKVAQAAVNLAEAVTEKACILALDAYQAIVSGCCKGYANLQKAGVWVEQKAVQVAQSALSAAKTAVNRISSYLTEQLKKLLDFAMEYVGMVTNGFGGTFNFLARMKFDGNVQNYQFDFQLTGKGIVDLAKSVFARVFSKGADEAQAKAKKDMPKLQLLGEAEHLVAVPDNLDAAQKALAEAGIDVQNVMEFDEWQKELVMLDEEQRSQEARRPTKRHVRVNIEGRNFVCSVSGFNKKVDAVEKLIEELSID